MFWKVYQKDNININRKSETPGNFGCPKGVEKSELFSQETYHSQNFRNETLKSHLLKKTKCAPLPHLVWKSQTIIGTFLWFSLIREWMNLNEYIIYDWTLMLLKDFREPLLSFELIYFRISFCCRIDNSWGFRYKILGHVGPLGKNFHFFVSLGIAEILGSPGLSVYTEIVLLKTFPQHFELCLCCKYRRSYKFYNLGDKTFETGFNFRFLLLNSNLIFKIDEMVTFLWLIKSAYFLWIIRYNPLPQRRWNDLVFGMAIHLKR